MQTGRDVNSERQCEFICGGNVSTIKTVLGTFRLPFLLLTPACVSVGAGTALAAQNDISLLSMMLVLLGATLAHISVNMFNEYDDFRSGLDFTTTRTAFSGGSGALPAHPDAASLIRIIAWATLTGTALIGVYFVYLHGYALIPLGILGLFLLVSYTRWWVYHPVLCLIAPGLGFGFLMVQGTHFALTGTYSAAALVSSLCPAFLVSALLLLNQFPDVEADKAAGRNHYPIAKGRAASAKLYALLVFLAYLSVAVGILSDILPTLTALAFLTSPLAGYVAARVIAAPDNIPALHPAMSSNVVINLLTPLLLAIGLVSGAN